MFPPRCKQNMYAEFQKEPLDISQFSHIFHPSQITKGKPRLFFFFLLLCQLCHPQIDCLISNPHWWCTEAKLQFKKLHYENSNLETERFVLHFSLYCHCRQPCTSYALKIEAICLNQCTTTD